MTAIGPSSVFAVTDVGSSATAALRDTAARGGRAGVDAQRTVEAARADRALQQRLAAIEAGVPDAHAHKVERRVGGVESGAVVSAVLPLGPGCSPGWMHTLFISRA